MSVWQKESPITSTHEVAAPLPRVQISRWWFNDQCPLGLTEPLMPRPWMHRIFGFIFDLLNLFATLRLWSQLGFGVALEDIASGELLRMCLY